ncbi:hypothetical protein V5O48_008684 [Marasmius crinis-equi]|uniref:Aspartate aminotransferase n=1 Tax=Marasmius crinis-equi TaxID=585013 RepID=A0ABR3FDA1_9AGAR
MASADVWSNVPLAPPDSIFKLTAAYKADTYEKKVNLGVGAYRDDDNKPWVLPVVRKVEQILLNSPALDHEYLPITGLPEFTVSAAKLILGVDSPAIAEGRVTSVQTISGTGANHLGALFLSKFYPWGEKNVYLSNPTWANHQAIFKNVGINPVDYPYYDPKTIGLDFNGFISALKSAPPKSVFLIHACAHNPTGVDPTREQWNEIADALLEKGHYGFFDSAYQGFASGDLDQDAWAVREFVKKGVPMLVCQSFAKNAGLYGERVGALHVISPDKATAERVKSQLSVLQRSEISNPPTYGARIVTKILNDPELFEEWRRDIKTMATRIIDMRKELYKILTEDLKTPGNWDHIVNQIGMFSFTGITAEQSKELTEKAHIYLTTNGRISMTGLNKKNIRYFAECLDKVVRGQFSPSAIPLDDPLQSSPLISPNLTFYTAPSTPLPETPSDAKPKTPASPPPFPILHITIPAQAHPSPTQFSLGHPSPNAFPSPSPHAGSPDPSPVPSPANIAQEAFPDPAELPVDMFFDDEGLSTLERIYLYSRSKASYHRVFIANALPDWLEQVTPQEAVEYVLPLLNTLAMDEDDMVKEAFASKLVTIMWWFLTHCQLTPEESLYLDDTNPPESHAHEGVPLISVQTFTPILGTLLLSPNAVVGGSARYAVVQLLERIKRLNSAGTSIASESSMVNSVATTADPNSETDPGEELEVGVFGRLERSLFEREILYQVVIGMGRLDAEDDVEASDDDTSQDYADALEGPQQSNVSVGRVDVSRYNRETQPAFPVNVVDTAERVDNDTLKPGREFQIDNDRKESSESAGPRARKFDNSINPYFPVSPTSEALRSDSAHSSFPASVGSPDSTESTPGSTTGSSASSDYDDGFFSLTRPSLSPGSSSETVTSPNPSASTSPLTQSPLPSRKPQRSPRLAGITATAASQPVDHQLSSTATSNQSRADTSFSPASLPNATGNDEPHPVNVDSTQDPAYNINASQEGEFEADQAAVGRLSSMSLMAAVAASGCSDDTIQRAFVDEVVRVSQDPIYWVRREACFALGALAKVVPEELVVLTLMPLFQSLASDPIEHVRHSSLYALPAILSRLPPRQRRALALDVLVPLSMDESTEVRSGVLEALGEVIYAFHSHSRQDPQGRSAATDDDDVLLPQQLLRMFLGRAKDRRKFDGHQTEQRDDGETTEDGWSDIEKEWMRKRPNPGGSAYSREEALTAFYEDASRPLICAFNIPAVALTLGRSRWAPELREAYLLLVKNDSPGVQRTLAASLGELGKIIGSDYAQKDLLSVWRKAVRNDEPEVRMKAVEAFEAYFGALERAGQRDVLVELLVVWEGGFLKGWRERQKIASCLGGAVRSAIGPELQVLIARLEVLSLRDAVNAVREAAISVLRTIWLNFQSSNDAFGVLKKEMHILAYSDTFRHRMTFVACLQGLILPLSPSESHAVVDIEDKTLPPIEPLTRDKIIGVRIGLARLLVLVFSMFTNTDRPIPPSIVSAVRILKTDPSTEVRAFVEGLPVQVDQLTSLRPTPSPPILLRTRSSSISVSTFSRPPPVPKSTLHKQVPVPA